MKKLFLILASLILSLNLYAGGYEAPLKVPASQESVTFYSAKDKEVTVFGLYLNRDKTYGGGLQGNYFVTKNLGVGVEAFSTGSDNYAGLVTGTYRLPLQRLAPYVFLGAGGIHDSDSQFLYQYGVGLEYRLAKNIGVKTDYSRNVSDNKSFNMVRAGLNFSF